MIATAQAETFALAIHGGAGTLLRSEMSAEREAEYRAVLERSLHAGYTVLQKGGSSVDAVTAAITIMEDSPLFNAGKGAVFNYDGKNELDASIMDGGTLKAGAVAGVQRVKNPILLARAVMDKSAHVMLMGEGAEKFAAENNIELVDPSYFHTDWRWQQLQKLKAKDKDATKLSEDHDKTLPAKSAELLRVNDNKFGTVGAVALDKNGQLAAATSTGGMTNKRWGRVGDSPIIGAGTYANSFCAVSATGHGEFFIRANVAHDICARVEYLHEDIQTAGDRVVMDKLKKMGGEGGVIIIDRQGRVALPFNSTGMYRASIDVTGKKVVAIFRD